MKLVEVVELLRSRRDIAKITVDQYRRSVKCYGRFLGRQATLSDLKEDSVNMWLASLSETLAKATVLGRLRGMTAVWNFASEENSVGYYERRKLRKIRVEFTPVVPWKVSELEILLAAAELVPGTLRNGTNASLFLKVLFRFSYETGFRPSDLRILKWDQLSLEEMTVSIRQHKTGFMHVAGFTEETRDGLRKLPITDERVFPISKSSVERWQQLLWSEAVKLGFRRKKGQALGYTRKSHGTEVAREHGLEEAARSLGHVSGTLTAKRHYVAPEVIAPKPNPPRLSDGRAIGRSKGREAA